MIQHDKVTPAHLNKQAYLYIRQSTIRQVFENSESTKRQYALKERAVALGWPLENIITIDDDLGRSGAESTQRSGFQRLVSEVGLDNAGIVMGLEVSRLARNCADWHRLLEICALTDTLILDQDGLYNPSDFNDRLILGLKGTMSEAELHMLKSRLQGGILSKAKRGELKHALPVGLVYTANDQVVLDPDCQVQETLKTFFSTFDRVGSAMATVRHFQQNNIKFPRQVRSGVYKGELVWRDLTHWKALQTLHNPRYAGAYCYGRRKQKTLPGGSKKYKIMPMEEWIALHKDAHPGYITWQQYERHVEQLKKNSRTYGHDRRQSPPREGPALLQGLIICGRCGDRMTLRYSKKKDGRQVPDYLCQREGIEHASEICQYVPGAAIDQAVNELILASVTPLTIDVALEVQQELESRSNEVVQLQQKRVERTRYDADLARARFMKVDPSNRLVANTLEAEWNKKLKELELSQDEYERSAKQEQARLSKQKRQKLIRLATDFPKLWNDPNTSNKEKKRIARLIIEDVTITRGEDIKLAIRFRGGATETLTLPPPRPAWALRKTEKAIIKQIDTLLEENSPAEIAEILNREGKVTGTGVPFTRVIIHHLRLSYRLKSRGTRMREQGYLTAGEVAAKLGVAVSAVKKWARQGAMVSYTDGKNRLYKIPDLSLIDNLKERLKPGRKNRLLETLTQVLEEVQYEV
jgi:DNA invertase Pin-like site-specific DNA recombinase